MAWESQNNISNIKYWTYTTGMTRSNISTSLTASLWNTSSVKTFSPNKNYQFITTVKNFTRNLTATYSKFLDIETPWGSTFSYATASTDQYDTRPFVNIITEMYYFSSPTSSEITSSDIIEYKSTYNGFGDILSDSDGIPYITNFKIVELDWFIQGWSLSPTNAGYHGWRYTESTNSFTWVSDTILNTTRYPIGSQGVGYTASNYISRLVNYPIFNISFDVSGANLPDDYLDVYLINSLSNLDEPGYIITPIDFNTELQNGQFLGKISDTGTYNFYNLTGEQYILFTSNYTETGTSITLTNIVIDGSYQEVDNNEQFLLTNYGTYSYPTQLEVIGGSLDATYSTVIIGEDTLHSTASTTLGATGYPGFFSTLYGDVINLNFINAKLGNGTFRAGIWENGVWNSGWRVDTGVYEFDDIEISLVMQTRNTKWRVQIKGPETSTSNFSIGDKVSIGNIIGIDINEKRKLMKNYFTILSVSSTNIVVEFDNTFPLRRIEKDSENHKIKITKNVWLNGGFLNGYFEGIWNAGLYKGFPYITEMYNTHWVDGKFDGGHFYSEYPEYTFVDTYYISGKSSTSLGLTFGATAHGFEIGDLIYIDKDNKSLNPQYDGDATVIDIIDDYLIVVDKQFALANPPEGGTIKRRTGTGVIQNFNFYDNNVAPKVLSTTNTTLPEVYKYNSWVDVKYLTQSASNLGRDLISYNPSFGEYVENNLYGFITEDVLSSVSSFRNSYSNNKSTFSLGTKYKIYEDFLGDISEFNEPFSSVTMDNFYNNGWTFSTIFGTNNYINREPNESILIELTDPISVFDLDNTNITISKKRYSIIEFDLVEYLAINDTLFSVPSIYLLNNINIPGLANPAFPISQYVYHALTSDVKKYEYFYNRRGLDILLMNIGGLTASFDNIKFYEIDMIPFFQYTTEEYVNKAVQIPYQGIAPFIDYNDSDFSFVDNINIGLDSLSTVQSFDPPSGDSGTTKLGEGIF